MLATVRTRSTDRGAEKRARVGPTPREADCGGGRPGGLRGTPRPGTRSLQRTDRAPERSPGVRYHRAMTRLLPTFSAVLVTLALFAPACRAPAPDAAAAADDAAISDAAVAADAPFVVEAACGQCQFGLPGESCDLAVRFDGHAWFVMGTSIDEHGDAHAGDGFCNAIRHARVTGRVVGDRFVVSSFQLLDDESPAPPEG